MNIWLDDLRNPKDWITPPLSHYNWTWVKNAKRCIDIIDFGNVWIISFDHDLGTELTGYDVAKYIEKLCYEGEIRCPIYHIHSANVIGAQNIKAAMINAKYYSNKIEREIIGGIKS